MLYRTNDCCYKTDLGIDRKHCFNWYGVRCVRTYSAHGPGNEVLNIIKILTGEFVQKTNKHSMQHQTCRLDYHKIQACHESKVKLNCRILIEVIETQNELSVYKTLT